MESYNELSNKGVDTSNSPTVAKCFSYTEVIIIEHTKQNKTYEKELSELMHLSTERRHKWRSKYEFFMASLCYLIGYDSTFLFVQICFKVGVVAIIPLLVTLIFYGTPVMYLEMSLGQFSSLDPPLLFQRLSPAMAVIGYAMCFVSFLALVSGHTIMIMCFEILNNSFSIIFNNFVAFASCHNYYNTQDCFEIDSECEAMLAVPWNGGCVRIAQLSIVKYENIINQTHSYYLNGRKVATYQYLVSKLFGYIDELMPDSPVPMYLMWLMLCWTLTAVITRREISFVCKVTYVNAITFVMLLALLFISGVVIEGDLSGFQNVFSFDLTLLSDPFIWIYCFTYISTCFKLGQGGLISIASYNDFHDNLFFKISIIVSAAVICPLLLIFALTPLYSAFYKILAFGHKPHSNAYREAIYKKVLLDGIVTSTSSFTLLRDYQGGLATIFALFMVFLCLGNQMMRMVLLVNSFREKFFIFHQRFYRNLAIDATCVLGFLMNFLLLTMYGIDFWRLSQFMIIPIVCSTVVLFETLTVAYFYGSKKLFTNVQAMLFGDEELDRRCVLWKFIPYFNGYMMLCWAYLSPLYIGLYLTIAFAYTPLYLLDYDDGHLIKALYYIFPLLVAFVLIILLFFIYKALRSLRKENSLFIHFYPNLMLWGPRHKNHRVLAQTQEERWRV